jgi:hypothetical protein
MVRPGVCLVVTVCAKQHQVGIPAVSPVAVSMVGFYMKTKVLAPTVDRAVTVGGFSASTPLPVGGPTAPATAWKSVQCQAFFIAACRDGASIHPLRPQVKTGSEPPLRFGHAPSLTVPLDAVEAGPLLSDEVGNQRLHVVLTITSHPIALVACHVASWQLPRLDFRQPADDSLSGHTSEWLARPLARI